MKNAEYGLTENLIFKGSSSISEKRKKRLPKMSTNCWMRKAERKRSRYPGTRAWKYFRHFSMNFLTHVSGEKQRKTSWIT